MPYETDSFLTLGPASRIGLALLSLTLAIGMIALTARLASPILAIPLFWAFLWLSPQIYYLYYQAIIDGLPWQSVIRTPPKAADLLRLLTFTGPPTLAAHGRGALGWAMVAAGLVGRRAAMRRRRP